VTAVENQQTPDQRSRQQDRQADDEEVETTLARGVCRWRR
jgi:hypothetical protein